MEKHVKPLAEEKPINAVEDATQVIFLLEILVAVFLVIITLVLVVLWRRRQAAGRNVLITGLSDSGKTLLYTRLLNKKFVQTQTSLKENIGDIKINDRPLRIIATPGDERLRYKFFDKYKNSAKCLIFMIDSSTIHANLRDVAEYLYTLLSDEAMQRNIPVLILCNKQDQLTSKGHNLIRILLENEINMLRMTKSNQLEATDSSSTSSYLGNYEKSFEFSQLNCKVEFAECYLFHKNAENPADLKQVYAWLEKIV